MQVRWAITIVYVAVLILAFVVQLFDPAISSLIFWGVLIWIVASFFMYRLPVMNRPLRFGRSPTPPAYGAPLPSSSGATTPVDVGFCVHCGTHIAPGTSVCPTCGRTVLPV